MFTFDGCRKPPWPYQMKWNKSTTTNLARGRLLLQLRMLRWHELKSRCKAAAPRGSRLVNVRLDIVEVKSGTCSTSGELEAEAEEGIYTPCILTLFSTFSPSHHWLASSSEWERLRETERESVCVSLELQITPPIFSPLLFSPSPTHLTEARFTSCSGAPGLQAKAAVLVLRRACGRGGAGAWDLSLELLGCDSWYASVPGHGWDVIS